LKRIIFFWITAPDEYWLLRGRNLFRQSVFLILSLTGFAGLYLANRNYARGVLLFCGVLFFYPLVYYVTHVEARYSHPLAPVMIILIVYAIREFYRFVPSHLLAVVGALNYQFHLESNPRVLFIRVFTSGTTESHNFEFNSGYREADSNCCQSGFHTNQIFRWDFSRVRLDRRCWQTAGATPNIVGSGSRFISFYFSR
jgi:hypothetical protein